MTQQCALFTPRDFLTIADTPVIGIILSFEATVSPESVSLSAFAITPDQIDSVNFKKTDC